MWQSWLIFIGGTWLTVSSFIWEVQTEKNLFVTGIVITILGFWDSKNLEGIMMGMLGLWVFACGLASYLNLPINYFLTGITIMFVAFIGILNNTKTPLTQGH